MAKDKITEYDATAANNTDVGGVNLAENSMNPSDVNNAIREVMSHQKEAFGSGTPLFVDQTNNRVGIGTSSPSAALQVVGSFSNQIKFGTNTSVYTDLSMGTGFTVFDSVGGDSGAFDFRDDGTSRMRIDSNGRVGIGTTSPNEPLRVQSDSDTDFDASTSAFNIALMLKNSTSGASNCVSLCMSTETNGEIYLSSVQNSGTQDSDFVISTRSGGSRAERMRIESDGDVLIGKDSTTINSDGTAISSTLGIRPVVSNDMCMLANRRGSDGTLIQFRQDSTAEGSISVSGTTVSYNGGHLSRWSQLTDNTRDNTIVKGTVMTNLDQMAEWTTDGVTEDNEQLNCMAISSVEGDVNVAGVFVNWDDDDDVYTNDMNVAMTGDMVIRIAKDTTVARGDLLMSAGDGTAKPQGDDIVRSKTIAKVTSTHKSYTYDDGTYLVPCVLMAC